MAGGMSPGVVSFQHSAYNKPAAPKKAPTPQPSMPRPTSSAQANYNAGQMTGMTGIGAAQTGSGGPTQGSYSGEGSGPSMPTPSYAPPVQAAQQPAGNTNSTFVNGSNLGREMDTIGGGIGGPLRGDLGNRTPPSLAALLQGLRY